MVDGEAGFWIYAAGDASYLDDRARAEVDRRRVPRLPSQFDGGAETVADAMADLLLDRVPQRAVVRRARGWRQARIMIVDEQPGRPQAATGVRKDAGRGKFARVLHREDESGHRAGLEAHFCARRSPRRRRSGSWRI